MWNKPTVKQLSKVPKLYANENKTAKDIIIVMHFFIGGSDWYIAEFDGEDIFYGYAILNNDLECAEWGYVSFSELCGINVRGIEVDRDLHWKEKKFGEIFKTCSK